VFSGSVGTITAHRNSGSLARTLNLTVRFVVDL
jgi:hypothetical protein